MFTADFGDRIEASLRFDYSGQIQLFTFAVEIGTILAGPPLPELTWNFNTLDRWELHGVNVAPGTGKTQKVTFTLNQAGGLNRGNTYDFNLEIGTGSKQLGTWKLFKRVFTNDIIKIAEGEKAGFSNLSVSYQKV